jgi:hypothetical protein
MARARPRVAVPSGGVTSQNWSLRASWMEREPQIWWRGFEAAIGAAGAQAARQRLRRVAKQGASQGVVGTAEVLGG